MTVKKTSVYIMLILMMYIIGVMLPLHYVWLIILILLYLFFLNKWINRKKVSILKIILLSLLLQNTFLGIGMHIFDVPSNQITIFSQVATIFTAIVAIWIIFIIDKMRGHMLFLIYMLVIFFNYYISPNKEIMLFLYNARNFTIFYFAYIIGKYLIDSEERFRDINRFIVIICLIAGFVGVVGYISDSQLYIWLGAAEVANLKTINSGAYILNGLPGYFNGDFFGTYMVRLGSLFLEPVNFSSFMALAVVLKAVHLKKTVDWMEFVFLLICQIMTFGKGGLLITSASIASLLLYELLTGRVDGKLIFGFTKWMLVVVVSVAGVMYGIFYSYNMHFVAIVMTIAALINQPLGFGIGTVGNVARDFSETGDYLGSETGVLNVWCQLGIEGLIIFTLLVYKMYKKNFYVYKNNPDKINFIFALMPMILYIVYIFQENIFTVQVITGYMFMIGAVSNRLKNNER